MKVAIIIERMEPWRGGAETSTLQFADHLFRLGCEVHVVTASDVPSSPALSVHPLSVKVPTREARSAGFLRRVEEFLSHQSFDIVHSMLPTDCCDVYQPRGGTVAESIDRNLALIRSPLARSAKQLANRLNVKQRRLLSQESRVFGRRGRPIIAALSRYVAWQLQEHYQMEPSRVRVVFNGVDVSDVAPDQREANRRLLREEYGVGPHEFVLLMVAHNFKLKGVARCVEAIGRIRAQGGPQAKVLIVGRDNPVRYRRLAERLGVAADITFVGPSDRISAFYQAVDILVHPTYYDPCSRVVLEAMANGVPAITTRHNGAGEVIEDGVQGYVIDSADDVEALADRICRLADPDHRRSCGEYGRKLRDRVSMARHAEGLLDVYREILAGRGQR